MKLRLVVVCVGALLLCACQKQPAIFDSPLIQQSPLEIVAPQTTQMYFPLTISAPNKLGISGGNSIQAEKIGATAYYTWWTHPDSSGHGVPMIWGRFVDVPQLGGNSRYALLMNEPDRRDQANMTPGEAAVMTWQALQAHADVDWVGPSVSQSGLAWLDSYMDTYKCLYGAYPDLAGLGMHCYRNTADECIALAEQFKTRLEKYGVTGGIWITEIFFSQKQEAQKFMAWANADEQIMYVFPFLAYTDCADPRNWNCAVAGNPSLFKADGTFTEIGSWYVVAQ